MRSHVSDVKINLRKNMKHLNVKFAIKKKKNSKKIILQCKSLNEKCDKFLQYEEILYGNVKMKVAVARKFIKNLELAYKIKEIKDENCKIKIRIFLPSD